MYKGLPEISTKVLFRASYSQTYIIRGFLRPKFGTPNLYEVGTVRPLLSADLDYPRFLRPNLVRPSTADNRGLTVV